MLQFNGAAHAIGAFRYSSFKEKGGTTKQIGSLANCNTNGAATFYTQW